MSIVQDPTHPTGVALAGGDKGGTHVRLARQRKALAALDLKVRGYPLEKIALVLGYPNGQAVGVALEKALGDELRDTDKSALRQIAGRRLEQAWRSLHDKINDPTHPDHVAAVNAGIKVIDRHAKLMGLDAPTELIVTTPSGQEMQEYVDGLMEQQRLLEGTTGIALEEADVLEAEAEWAAGDGDDDDVVLGDLDEIPEPTDD